MYSIYFSTDNELWHPALTFEFMQKEEAIAVARALKAAIATKEFAVDSTYTIRIWDQLDLQK
jgi:hypothetical protein